MLSQSIDKRLARFERELTELQIRRINSDPQQQLQFQKVLEI